MERYVPQITKEHHPHTRSTSMIKSKNIDKKISSKAIDKKYLKHEPRGKHLVEPKNKR